MELVEKGRHESLLPSKSRITTPYYLMQGLVASGQQRKFPFCHLWQKVGTINGGKNHFVNT